MNKDEERKKSLTTGSAAVSTLLRDFVTRLVFFSKSCSTLFGNATTVELHGRRGGVDCPGYIRIGWYRMVLDWYRMVSDGRIR